ncbi:hypothetical protein OAC63_00990 [Amylibacter sp.]|jgi:hypothetical protein|nr:hypothetical protein [Amylibacter sp.]MDB9856950.1 hypothetical protein [Amylibacter sp.]
MSIVNNSSFSRILFSHILIVSNAAFVNYTPHHTTLSYAVHLSLVLICIGLMLEHYARNTVSESWGKRN